MQNKILVAITVLSLALAIYLFVTPPSLKDSVSTLERFSAKLAKVNKKNPITKEEEEEIRRLAKATILLPKFANANTVSSIGVSFISDKNDNKVEPVVLSALTGKNIKSCGKIGFSDDNADKSSKAKDSGRCVEIAEIDEGLKSALEFTSPVDVSITVKGEKKQAKMITIFQFFYKGSDCITYYVGGYAFEYCQSGGPSR